MEARTGVEDLGLDGARVHVVAVQQLLDPVHWRIPANSTPVDTTSYAPTTTPTASTPRLTPTTRLNAANPPHTSVVDFNCALGLHDDVHGAEDGAGIEALSP